MCLRPTTRTLSSFVLRTMVPRVVLFGVGALALLLGQVLAVEPSPQSTSLPSDQVVQRVPVWTVEDSATYPGCVPSRAWPSGTPAAAVVVHSFRAGRHLRLPFDAAWRANHNGSEADDVWVVGVCR
jgi:hypothetical protein